METFLSNHVPNFLDHQIRRDLLKVAKLFEWDHKHILEQIKQLIAGNVGIEYYNSAYDVSLEIDATSKG